MSKQVPPPWNVVGQHGVFPKAKHDEVARFNFLTNLNQHLAQQVLPGVAEAYEKRAKPAFEKQAQTEPKSRQEVRHLMEADSFYQTWSCLRRNTMEMRQQAGRSMVLRQADSLNERARELNEGAETLQLNANIEIPRYVSAVDIHCMPGCYYTAYSDDDVTAGANYDCGLFVTTAGMLGRYSDGGGQALVKWIQGQADFNPKRILDIGSTVGHNIVPLAQAFPDAEIVAIDVAAPVLRYAHARARSLGVSNITFRQANAEQLEDADGCYDLIITSMFLHETSSKALPKVINETHRLLANGGKVVHLEQPQYTDEMPLFEQFMRDWDTYNNNEPFWGCMHDINLFDVMEKAGFERKKLSVIGIVAVADTDLFPSTDEVEGEDFGRKPVWNAYIASK